MPIETGLAALLSPMILFFVLGGFAGLVRSDLSVPEPIGNAMSLYLKAAIGLRGGMQVVETGFSTDIAAALAAGIALSLLLNCCHLFTLIVDGAPPRGGAVAFRFQCKCDRVINIDAEISDGILDVRMTQQG